MISKNIPTSKPLFTATTTPLMPSKRAKINPPFSTGILAAIGAWVSSYTYQFNPDTQTKVNEQTI
ncbi:MAG: hypothetical protein EAZ46_11550 [Runella sp.]|nr:MAG: hypothetical protein EAZ46_11550 [Runella sp.]